MQWFTKAGFTDVRIKRIGPTWYRGVRRHGLIMGCSVTGVKPKVLAFPLHPLHASSCSLEPALTRFPRVHNRTKGNACSLQSHTGCVAMPAPIF